MPRRLQSARLSSLAARTVMLESDKSPSATTASSTSMLSVTTKAKPPCGPAQDIRCFVEDRFMDDVYWMFGFYGLLPPKMDDMEGRALHDIPKLFCFPAETKKIPRPNLPDLGEGS